MWNGQKLNHGLIGSKLKTASGKITIMESMIFKHNNHRVTKIVKLNHIIILESNQLASQMAVPVSMAARCSFRDTSHQNSKFFNGISTFPCSPDVHKSGKQDHRQTKLTSRQTSRKSEFFIILKSKGPLISFSKSILAAY